jgi:tRNA A-37 threonylcarbamoyl transferase component Bud32
MEQFKPKNTNELDSQLGRIEQSFIGARLEPENIREELLSMDLASIKEKYPGQYQTYTNLLKTEVRLLHFPDIDLKNNLEKPAINLLPATTRSNAFKITFSESSAHVIKPLESLEEKDVSEKASALGIGPKQFKTNEGYLHEEFIDGTPLLNLERGKCTPEFMEELGGKFMKALKQLHDNNILVNDQILTNDFGKSHMIIDKEGEVRFIDFGASIDISDFPNISDEAVWSLMRTDALMMFRMNSIVDSSEEQKKEEVKGYRENILSQFKSKEDLIEWKDFQLLNEGLSFLHGRLPNVGAFIEGIKKGM